MSWRPNSAAASDQTSVVNDLRCTGLQKRFSGGAERAIFRVPGIDAQLKQRTERVGPKRDLSSAPIDQHADADDLHV